MEKVTTLNKAPLQNRDKIIAIGNFDGFHQGHQALINKTKQLAGDQNLSSAVLSFSPHPRLFFNPNQDPFQLLSSKQKDRLLKYFGVEYYYELPFDQEFATLSARDFVIQVINNTVNAAGIIVGEDFRFGVNREGDINTLRALGAEYGFDVYVMDPVCDEAHYTISSTIIREALRSGDLKRANALLSHPKECLWEMEGVVIHGDKRGRELGYPTANMRVDSYIRPKYGVYAVRVCLEEDLLTDQWLPAVANFGVRPMFEVQTPLLETYIFDFDEEIYDQNLRVQFVSHLRGEMNFQNLENLVKQMDQDCLDAKECLRLVSN